MIQSGTRLNVIDNSGAKSVSCIKVSKGYRRRYAFVGDVITVSVKSLRSKRKATSKVKKGDVVKALVVRTKTGKKDFSGKSLGFFENSVVLLTNQYKPIGSRIFGTLPKFFDFSKYLKVSTISSNTIN
jgi:large subunit ribosomal protein L14|tara:strand:+ start:190 stop:573 length:384 start_codon:yes stop_codon:yes gene_type:complete